MGSIIVVVLVSHISFDQASRCCLLASDLGRCPDIDDGSGERNNSRVCRNTGRCVRDSRDASYVRYLGIRYVENRSRSGCRCRTRPRIDPSERGKSDNPRGDTAKVLNIQRASEMTKAREKERKRDSYSRLRVSSNEFDNIRQHCCRPDELSFMFQGARQFVPTIITAYSRMSRLRVQINE